MVVSQGRGVGPGILVEGRTLRQQFPGRSSYQLYAIRASFVIGKCIISRIMSGFYVPTYGWSTN